MPYDIQPAEAAQSDAVMNTLLLSFSSDPCVRYVFSTAEAYLAGFPTFARAMGGRALEHGSAWLGGGGSVAALWLPPGVESDSEAMFGLIMAHAAPEKLEVMGQVAEGMGRYHPEEPHWYLSMIGVDPARQGLGLGSAMLAESLRQCDKDGTIAYLESSNPRNIPLYERHGFEVMGVVQPGDFPGLYPMLRPAGG